MREGFARDELADMERTLSYSVYCNGCGFDLRHQTYVGRCPECNGEYNARPTSMKGILNVGELKLPFVDGFLAVICLGFGGMWLAANLNPVNDWLVMLASLVILLGLGLARRVWVDAHRFFRLRHVFTRIEHDDDA